MLIDVTRLADRYLQGRLPTGVDRVSLAYLDHFGEKARALVRFGGRWIELPFSDSQRLFSALLGGQASASSFVRWLVARAYATSWRQSPATVLFNTGHSGLDSDDYAIRVRERGLRPVFFLHDLIPISHPEYCRAGEAERHHRRLDTMLSVGRGLVVNSRATLDDLEAYAGARQLALPPCAVAPLAPGSLPAPSRG